MTDQITVMSPAAVAKVRQMEAAAGALPQVSIETEHTFHAGMYARTVMIPAGVVITGALIKIPTILIVSGDAVMYGEGGSERIVGYRVLSAAAGRKQAFLAMADTWLTMLFSSQANDEMEAESEFTDEADLLVTRRDALENARVKCLA